MSAMLLAYLPYPVIFSCFSYKDCFVSLCTFYILYNAVKIKYIHKITSQEILLLIICIISLFLTRSGLSVVLLSMVALYYYFDKIRDCLVEGWAKGGEGAIDIAQKLTELVKREENFNFIYMRLCSGGYNTMFIYGCYHL